MMNFYETATELQGGVKEKFGRKYAWAEADGVEYIHELPEDWDGTSEDLIELMEFSDKWERDEEGGGELVP